MSNGALIGVPIPEEYEAVGEVLQSFVEQAVREAEENGVSKRGKEATPWLLKRVGELSQGKSLASSECSPFYDLAMLSVMTIRRRRINREHGSCW
jgi:pseudouridine-5'-phosphate glycosidase